MVTKKGNKAPTPIDHTKRKLVTRRFKSVDMDDLFDGKTLSEFQAEVAKFVAHEASLLDPGESLIMETVSRGYDGAREHNLKISSEETDEEYAARMSELAQQDERRRNFHSTKEAKDRELYLALHKRFGNETK